MTDLGTTKRKHFSPRQRLAIWEEHKGICCICGEKIDGSREAWIIEHVRALGLSGSNEMENTKPAHAQCANEKTREDIARIAKAKRQKQKHIGIRKPSQWRNKHLKKKMDGTVVDRQTGEPIK